MALLVFIYGLFMSENFVLQSDRVVGGGPYAAGAAANVPVDPVVSSPDDAPSWPMLVAGVVVGVLFLTGVLWLM